ncbi:hypothetical protein EMCG_06053 [[Emmonsia] crescens]|uniref:Uncharacterized protein n=1 Tax=[Emmonsia] crescens TaxID=73230 RepID=A0A0G2ICA0_9EURO|nr:hypothetical protein EMCG_06053 [Emmonsia crescens UAMH 3008]
MGCRGAEREGLFTSPAPIYHHHHIPKYNPHRYRHLHGHKPLQIPHTLDNLRIRHARPHQWRKTRPATHGLADAVEACGARGLGRWVVCASPPGFGDV